MFLEYRCSFRTSLPYHSGNSALKNAGFLESYLLQSVTKQITMVQSYACDDAQVRHYYIGTVQTPAESNLYNRNIHTLLRKPFESQACSNLKEREVQLIKCLRVFGDKIIHIFFGDQFRLAAVNDSHTLTEIKNMRRGIETDFQSRSRKHRRQHICHRTFAVSPRDVNRAICPFRISQPGTKALNMLQSRFIGIAECCILNRWESSENSFDHLFIFRLRKHLYRIFGLQKYS